MNPLTRALVEKAGYENGFENNSQSEGNTVRLSSARHSAQVVISVFGDNSNFLVIISSSLTASLAEELNRSYSEICDGDNSFVLTNISDLSIFLRRAAALAQALPNQVVNDYQNEIDEALYSSIETQETEIERLVRQRIGQDRFRNAMLSYWGNACAVTGITLIDVLRASHAKPWSECTTDAERLDVFNGFLLCANLDALFDRFLITFDADGQMVISGKISSEQRQSLGINKPLALRWFTEHHQAYLDYHRELFYSAKPCVAKGRYPRFIPKLLADR